MSSLNSELIKLGYVPSVKSSAKSNAKWLMRIIQILNRFALADVCEEPAPKQTLVQSNLGALNTCRNLDSTLERSGDRGRRPSQPHSEWKKRARPSSKGGGSSRKWSKSVLGPRTTPGPGQTTRSSGLALTNVTARGALQKRNYNILRKPRISKTNFGTITRIASC